MTLTQVQTEEITLTLNGDVRCAASHNLVTLTWTGDTRSAHSHSTNLLRNEPTTAYTLHKQQMSHHGADGTKQRRTKQ